ncbi:MAG: VWA-like domain-containing protein [Cyanobacteria bacterium P01_A01_bin.84]
MTEDTQKIISASLLRLRMKSPFFATLALFARFIPSDHLPTAATDGQDVFFNPEFLLSLSTSQQDGVLLHEVLHAALLHVTRRGVRDAKLWNIAADIVVNGMIYQQGVFELPLGVIRDTNLENFSVEEIYEILQKDPQKSPLLSNPDLLDRPPLDVPEDKQNQEDKNIGAESDIFSDITGKREATSQGKKAEMEAHWRNALQQAATISRTMNQGNLPSGIERELGSLNPAQIDWRTYLWRYIVQTPTDFSGFDRRFVGRGMYLENLQGESVNVFVAIDTSGSIDHQQLQVFLSEVRGILRAYPHLKCELYYADAQVYGPFELESDSEIPLPEGGGGTSFIPFFEKVAGSWDRQSQAVCVYLTDGYGNFPKESPDLPVLWVVTAGGLELESFPFGEAVRLLGDW